MVCLKLKVTSIEKNSVVNQLIHVTPMQMASAVQPDHFKSGDCSSESARCSHFRERITNVYMMMGLVLIKMTLIRGVL